MSQVKRGSKQLRKLVLTLDNSKIQKVVIDNLTESSRIIYPTLHIYFKGRNRLITNQHLILPLGIVRHAKVRLSCKIDLRYSLEQFGLLKLGFKVNSTREV